jgi:hypothetical protein
VDLLAIKLARPRPVCLEGGSLELLLRPLPEMEIQAAERDAMAQFPDPELAGELAQDEVMVRLLAAAGGASPDEVRGLFDRAELGMVFRSWSKIQVASMPPAKGLKAACDIEVHFSNEVRLDGFLAHQAASPAEFYGKALTELTLGQVAYFYAVRAAWEKVNVRGSDGSETMVSRSWLEKKRRDG